MNTTIAIWSALIIANIHLSQDKIVPAILWTAIAVIFVIIDLAITV